jgi:hypothetical protein
MGKFEQAEFIAEQRELVLSLGFGGWYLAQVDGELRDYEGPEHRELNVPDAPQWDWDEETGSFLKTR